ncbi:hypothetical protein [Dictyobacter formicarum]
MLSDQEFEREKQRILEQP